MSNSKAEKIKRLKKAAKHIRQADNKLLRQANAVGMLRVMPVDLSKPMPECIGLLPPEASVSLEPWLSELGMGSMNACLSMRAYQQCVADSPDKDGTLYDITFMFVQYVIANVNRRVSSERVWFVPVTVGAMFDRDTMSLVGGRKTSLAAMERALVNGRTMWVIALLEESGFGLTEQQCREVIQEAYETVTVM